MYHSFSGKKRYNTSQASRNYKSTLVATPAKGIRKSASGRKKHWDKIASHTKMWFGTRNLWIGLYGEIEIDNYNSKFKKNFSSSGVSFLEKITIIMGCTNV